MQPKGIELVFRSETLAGDDVIVERAKSPEGENYHRVFSPDGKDHVVAIVSL
jgi:hypothetical protein